MAKPTYPRASFTPYTEAGTTTNEHGETFAVFTTPAEIGVQVGAGPLVVTEAKGVRIDYAAAGFDIPRPMANYRSEDTP